MHLSQFPRLSQIAKPDTSAPGQTAESFAVAGIGAGLTLFALSLLKERQTRANDPANPTRQVRSDA